MKKVMLEDVPAGRKFNLGELVIKAGKVTLGRRDCEYVKDNTISLGIDVDESDNNQVVKISGRHASITYKPDTKLYTLRDEISKNGTDIHRGKKVIELSRFGIISSELQDKDEIFFGGYGPVIFTEKETEKRKADGTRVSVFE